MPSEYPCPIARSLVSELLIQVIGFQTNLPLLLTWQCWGNLAMGSMMLVNLLRPTGLCCTLHTLQMRDDMQCLTGIARYVAVLLKRGCGFGAVYV